jgi:hypothetical protein
MRLPVGKLLGNQLRGLIADLKYFYDLANGNSIAEEVRLAKKSVF